MRSSYWHTFPKCICNEWLTDIIFRLFPAYYHLPWFCFLISISSWRPHHLHLFHPCSRVLLVLRIHVYVVEIMLCIWVFFLIFSCICRKENYEIIEILIQTISGRFLGTFKVSTRYGIGLICIDVHIDFCVEVYFGLVSSSLHDSCKGELRWSLAPLFHHRGIGLSMKLVPMDIPNPTTITEAWFCFHTIVEISNKNSKYFFLASMSEVDWRPFELETSGSRYQIVWDGSCLRLYFCDGVSIAW